MCARARAHTHTSSLSLERTHTLLQMLALVAMEQPLSFDAEDIRAEKLKVLRADKPLKLCDLVTGQ